MADDRQKRRGSDRVKERLPEILIPVVLLLIAWGVRQEVSSHVDKGRIEQLERKELVRWDMIGDNEKALSQLKNDSENHAKRADEAIRNAKDRLCDLTGRIFRLESLTMKKAEIIKK